MADLSFIKSGISAVILVRNEQNNIRYCLEGLTWCDEIVIVDMESEDDTVKIAREYSDRIFTHKRIIAFDIAKKFAIEKATKPWILLVDADEMLPVDLARELRRIADEDEADAVQIAFKNYLLGEWNRYTGWWPNYHCRFFKKEVMDISDRIHAYSVLSQTAKTRYLPAKESMAIHHFAYRDAEQFILKLNRYTNIEAKHYFDDGMKFSFYLFFKTTVKEFIDRYIRLKGYKDGMRGFFVSIMMSMYRAVACIKLWELHEYKEEVSEKYNRLKTEIIGGYQHQGAPNDR